VNAYTGSVVSTIVIPCVVKAWVVIASVIVGCGPKDRPINRPINRLIYGPVYRARMIPDRVSGLVMIVINRPNIAVTVEAHWRPVDRSSMNAE
jgi:hypothetical protein